jgi:deoxyribose-phosphate aldolase
MDPNETAQTLKSYEELSSRMVHALNGPELTDDEILDGCRRAADYGVASVLVRPSDIDAAVRQLDGTAVAPGAAAGFPHGASTTAVKLYEIRDLIRRGAREVELVVNIGKLISRQFQYVETEILQASRACHESGALLTINLETPLLARDLKIIALKICKRCEADFVKTSTGFAPAVDFDADLALLGSVLKGVCRIEACGGIESLDAALSLCALGADRIGTAHSAAILDEWRARLEAAADEAAESK